MRVPRPRRSFLRFSLVGTALLAFRRAHAQRPAQPPSIKDEPPQVPVPNPTQLHVKLDYDQNLKDARELSTLAHSIEADLEQAGQDVLSVGLLKKLDDVDRISRRMSARMKH